MQPPIVALVAAMAGSFLRRTRIAGDLHTAVFDNPKWTWATSITLRLLRKPGNLAIVTNAELAKQIEGSGGEALVLHDLIETYDDRGAEPLDDEDLETQIMDVRFVLVPVTYAYDEPLDELVDAAIMTPEVTWLYTGRAPSWIREKAPSNIKFSGFVGIDDYLRLLSRAAAVVAPTTSESTMQRAGYEALSAGKPLMTTATRVLMEYFGEAAVASSITAEGFASGIRELLNNSADYELRMSDLRRKRIDDQELALERLKHWTKGHSTKSIPKVASR
ncbi:glycosyltransferase [Cellulosimicrobium funkei]|nr:glycosyltransferase [Cellulosimicrobium funkei]